MTLLISFSFITVNTFLNAEAQRREDAKEDQKTARSCIQQIQFRAPSVATRFAA
jgi:hypothetical protein